MRVIRSALAFLLAIALLTVPAWAIDLEPGAGSGFYCRDTADVLSTETEQLLGEYNAVLENQCGGAQLVVATVSYLSEDADLAATELMSDWGVGSASESNGALILLVRRGGPDPCGRALRLVSGLLRRGCGCARGRPIRLAAGPRVSRA